MLKNAYYPQSESCNHSRPLWHLVILHCMIYASVSPSWAEGKEIRPNADDITDWTPRPPRMLGIKFDRKPCSPRNWNVNDPAPIAPSSYRLSMVNHVETFSVSALVLRVSGIQTKTGGEYREMPLMPVPETGRIRLGVRENRFVSILSHRNDNIAGRWS